MHPHIFLHTHVNLSNPNKQWHPHGWIRRKRRNEILNRLNRMKIKSLEKNKTKIDEKTWESIRREPCAHPHNGWMDGWMDGWRRGVPIAECGCRKYCGCCCGYWTATSGNGSIAAADALLSIPPPPTPTPPPSPTAPELTLIFHPAEMHQVALINISIESDD